MVGGKLCLVTCIYRGIYELQFHELSFETPSKYLNVFLTSINDLYIHVGLLHSVIIIYYTKGTVTSVLCLLDVLMKGAIPILI